MAELLTLLHQRAVEPWLVGSDLQPLTQQVERLLQQLQQAASAPQKVLLIEADPIAFIAGLAAAQSLDWAIFLANPDWGTQEWQQVHELVQPHWVLRHGNLIPGCQAAPPMLECHRATIQIPTGGSSGKIRFATHTWQTLIASVQGFQQYFQLESVNSFCTLPLYHVSGLMQLLRSLTSGGRLALMPFKAVEAGAGRVICPQNFVVSLVPTQLQRLLAQPFLLDWLRQFQIVLLGGGSAWGTLLEQARHHRIPLAPTYGMTETASQVVTLKPGEFLAGNSSCGQVLPHARIGIQDAAGQVLPSGQVGLVSIQAASLALGYYPDRFDSGVPWQGDDLGYFDDRQYLHLLGRSSYKIITGGENVYPVEVEAAILATNLVQDVWVVGLPDATWGEAIAALYVPRDTTVSPAQIKTRLQEQLSRYKLPKHWLSLPALPRNAQGKVNYAQLKQLALDQFS